MTLPCGIALRANNTILVESVFHGARPVKYRNKCDTNAPAVRIFHGAKGAKLGEEGEIGEKITLAKAQRALRKRIKKVFFAILASWRENLCWSHFVEHFIGYGV